MTDVQVPGQFDASGSDALYTVREVCAMLSIGNTKCWELIGNGQLKAVRLGGRCTRIRRSSVDRLIQCGVGALTTGTAPPPLCHQSKRA